MPNLENLSGVSEILNMIMIVPGAWAYILYSPGSMGIHNCILCYVQITMSIIIYSHFAKQQHAAEITLASIH